ncbi:mevalonate kinase [Candidatus Roizmanbacteria bacterium]|nr:mevalonate kinase [Candidatus Roizmanbacteria bacterium]
MKTITASAPGKLHLLGEHVVVYGNHALLTAISKRCTTTVSEANEGITISFLDTHKHCHYSLESIYQKLKRQKTARTMYSETGDTHVLKNMVNNPFDYLILILGEIITNMNRTTIPSIAISIHSEIPVGSGMGSSAALAVSTIGAVTAFLGTSFEKSAINEIAHRCEQWIHGTPSGGDTTTCCEGGTVYFQKKKNGKIDIELLESDHASEHTPVCYILQTGKPLESTGDMVALVKAYKEQHPNKFDTILQSQESLTQELRSAFIEHDVKKMYYCIKEGEINLEKLMIVSDKARECIHAIEESGGSAKISGAGGIKIGSGIVLAFHSDDNRIHTIASKFKYPIQSIILGQRGLHYE